MKKGDHAQLLYRVCLPSSLHLVHCRRKDIHLVRIVECTNHTIILIDIFVGGSTGGGSFNILLKLLIKSRELLLQGRSRLARLFGDGIPVNL